MGREGAAASGGTVPPKLSGLSPVSKGRPPKSRAPAKLFYLARRYGKHCLGDMSRKGRRAVKAQANRPLSSRANPWQEALESARKLLATVNSLSGTSDKETLEGIRQTLSKVIDSATSSVVEKKALSKPKWLNDKSYTAEARKRATAVLSSPKGESSEAPDSSGSQDPAGATRDTHTPPNKPISRVAAGEWVQASWKERKLRRRREKRRRRLANRRRAKEQKEFLDFVGEVTDFGWQEVIRTGKHVCWTYLGPFHYHEIAHFITPSERHKLIFNSMILSRSHPDRRELLYNFGCDIGALPTPEVHPENYKQVIPYSMLLSQHAPASCCYNWRWDLVDLTEGFDFVDDMRRAQVMYFSVAMAARLLNCASWKPHRVPIGSIRNLSRCSFLVRTPDGTASYPGEVSLHQLTEGLPISKLRSGQKARGISFIMDPTEMVDTSYPGYRLMSNR